MPSLASTACTWSLPDDRCCTSLIRYLVSSRSSRTSRRGDPRLGQPAHPQQVSQIRGVLLVVLDPPVTERLDPERMGQVHLRPGSLEHVGRPVPPVSGLDHHPRVLPRPGEHSPQRRGAVIDADGLQLRPSSVIRTSTLRRRCRSIPTTCRPSYASVIVGLLAWWRRMPCNFQHPPGAEARS